MWEKGVVETNVSNTYALLSNVISGYCLVASYVVPIWQNNRFQLLLYVYRP